MTRDMWFEEWYQDEAINLLEAVYRNPDKTLKEIHQDELDVGDSIYRRLKRECRDRDLLRTQRGTNLGRQRVTEQGKRFLLQHNTGEFLQDKASAVVNG